MKKVLVIGSLNIDFSTSVDKIPSPGETVNASNLLINNGGKGANQAYTIGKLGGNVSMLGCIGKDEYGKNEKEALRGVGVYVSGIYESNTVDTGKAFINVSFDGENAITIVHGANYEVNEEFIMNNTSYIEEADIILMQLEIPLNTIKKILELAKDKIIILDPAPADKEIINFDLSNVYLMKPNETEIETLTNMKVTDEESAKVAAYELLKKGVKNILVSLGKKGSYLINKEEIKFFPCIESNVVDTTAAGDSFVASIALGLSQDKSLEESILFASKVASIVVTKKGAQSSIPTLEEVI